MELKPIITKIVTLLQRYKYVLVVVVIGIALMAIPFGRTVQTEQNTTCPTQQTVDPAKQLSGILGKIKGAGRVEVLLTIDEQEKTVYQTDSEQRIEGENQSIRHDTVVITDSNRNQQGLIQQVIAAKYRGAVVVCQGADDPAVKLSIMEAVKNATGLGYDKISVLKMN